MTLEGSDASSALGAGARVTATGSDELPHLDGPVQTTRHKIPSVGCEGNRVDGILVAVRALEALHQVSVGSIPYADALVEGASRDVLGIGRDSDGGHTVLNAEGQDVLTSLDVPESNGAVAATRCDSTSIAREVEGVDILLVASKAVSDGPVGNVPNLKNVS